MKKEIVLTQVGRSTFRNLIGKKAWDVSQRMPSSKRIRVKIEGKATIETFHTDFWKAKSPAPIKGA